MMVLWLKTKLDGTEQEQNNLEKKERERNILARGLRSRMEQNDFNCNNPVIDLFILVAELFSQYIPR